MHGFPTADEIENRERWNSYLKQDFGWESSPIDASGVSGLVRSGCVQRAIDSASQRIRPCDVISKDLDVALSRSNGRRVTVKAVVPR